MEQKDDFIRQLHHDLVKKYQRHGPKLERIWRSFDRNQRATAFKAGANNGDVLKHPLDKSLGNVYKVIPEMNLRDVTEPGSDYLLDYIRHRVTPLCEQYAVGFNGGLGDALFIQNSMLVNRLALVNPIKHSFTMFIDEEKFGKCYDVAPARYEEVMASMAVAVRAGRCVERSTGELILERLLYTFQQLSILIDDILLDGSTSINTNTRPKKPEEPARAALSNLSLAPQSAKASPTDLLADALDQKTALNDYLNLCCTEPVVLVYAVNAWFFTRPELIPDEKGRMLPVVSDKYISISFFETIHNAIAGAANWNYIHRLLQVLVDESKDKLYKGILLQEISNICHLEYLRAQGLFKRQVQSRSGSKHFKRVYNVYDAGVARVITKGKLDDVERDNPELSYMLRLCQTETNAQRSVAWIKKLDDFYQSHPVNHAGMNEGELDSFCDLAVIAGFIQSLSASFALPTASQKKGQTYVSGSKNLAAELNALKTQIDLGDFAAPIDNLREPGMAEGALDALDQFIIDKTGTKMGFLYQDLIESCVESIRDHYQRQKDTQDKAWVTLPVKTPSQEARIQERRQKDKTRPAHSSIYEIHPTESADQPETVEAPPVFKVKQETADIFSAIFSKSESRGSITWTAFQGAMADLKFSVIPKFGSVYTFFPPKDMAVQKPLTIHRPHQSKIEGYQSLIFASRLSKLYGWAEESFVAA